MKRLIIILWAGLILWTACSPLRNCPDLSASYEPDKPRLKQQRSPLTPDAAIPLRSLSKVNPLNESLSVLVSLSTEVPLQPAAFLAPVPDLVTPTFTKKEQKRLNHLKKKLERTIPQQMLVEEDSSIVTQEDITYQKARKLGNVSFGLAIGSVVALLVPPLIFPLALASLITGSMSLKRFRKVTNKEGRGLALTAVIISSVWLGLILLLVALLILLIASFNGGL